ncbi:MAG: Ig domain-containing protein [Fibromonadaceae bacterium]|nr:Ig domain-containing protein [Fibromonadaceae bacterium]
MNRFKFSSFTTHKSTFFAWVILTLTFGFFSLAQASPSITTASLPDGKVGQYYYAELSASESGTWSVTGGELPPGLWLGDCFSAHCINGSPELSGSYTFAVKVENPNGSDTKNFTINIVMPEKPIITKTNLSNGKVGESYGDNYFGYSLSSYANEIGRWSLVAGKLPPNLQIEYMSYSYSTPEGYVCGTPLVPGTFNFTLRITNAAGFDEKEFTIIIEGDPLPPPFITTDGVLSNGEVGSSYNVQLYSSHPVAEWSIVEGSLPPGLSITKSNYDSYYQQQTSIYGTPTTAGTYTFTVRAETGDNYHEKQFTIEILPMKAPIISTNAGPLQGGKVGEHYNSNTGCMFGIGTCISSDRAATWSVVGDLPPGLWLRDYGYNSYNTYIYGTPTASGNFTFTIRAENSGGSDTKTFSINIAKPDIPAIITSTLPNGEVGNSYRVYLSINGFGTRSIVKGELPLGLDINSSYSYDGFGIPLSDIFGTPLMPGIFKFTLRVENESGFDEKEFTIEITGDPLPPPSITDGYLPEREVGVWYNGNINATSYAKWSIVEGALPPGLTISGSNIYGTPTEHGSFTFKVKAENGAGSDIKEFTIVILPVKPPTITTESLANGEVGIHYYAGLNSISETAVWSISEGILPPGLGLGGSSIDGTPTEQGTFTFTVMATNAAGQSDTKTFTIVIEMPEAPKITTESLPRGGGDYYYYSNYYYEQLSATSNAEWSIVGGNLPPGFELRSNGYISGYAYGDYSTPETFTFTVKATNGAGSDTKTLSITLGGADAPKITTESVPKGKLHDSYSAWFGVSFNATFSIVHSDLPNCEFNDYSYRSAGIKCGILNTSGTYSITIRVENSAGYDEKTFTIEVEGLPPSQPFITTTSLCDGEVGVSYGGIHCDWFHSKEPVAEWSISAGALPNGLSLQSFFGYGYHEAYIEGTPTTVGPFTFTVRAENGDNFHEKEFTIIIAEQQPPAIYSKQLPKGEVGGEYLDRSFYGSVTIEASRFAKWSIIGNLPPGLDFEENGSNIGISGIPTQVGVFPFKVKAENDAGSDEESFSIEIVATQFPTITTTSLQNGTLGSYYPFGNQPHLQSASLSATWEVINGKLPPGLSVSSDGRISGTPTEIGTFTFTVKATNGVGQSDTKQFSITVRLITTESLPKGMVGVEYNGSISAGYGYASAAWSVVEGALPPGLEISSYGSSATISGTPTQLGTYTFTIKAEINMGNMGCPPPGCGGKTISETKEFTIVIEAPPAPFITTGSLPNAEVDANYSVKLESTVSGTWNLTAGTLPPGLMLNLDGSISGTPTTAGTFTFTVKVTNMTGSATRELSITVLDKQLPTILTTSLPNGNYGEKYHYKLESASLSATWEIIAGDLPQGLWLTECGQINGEFEEVGTFTFTVKATNAAGQSDTKQFSIAIRLISTTSLSNGMVGQSYWEGLSSWGYTEWSIVPGVGTGLPPGLNFSCPYSYVCSFSGTPTQAGTFTFAVKAEMENYYTGGTVSETREFTIVIELPPKPKINTIMLPTGELGEEYNMHIWAEHASLLDIKDLPKGLDYYCSSSYPECEIYGIPTELGVFNITIEAENITGTDTKILSLIIKEPQTPTIITTTLPNGRAGEWYEDIQIESRSPSAIWSVINGELPKGFELTDGGYIYGYPEEAGTFTFIVKAENSSGSDTKQFTIVIEPLSALMITTQTLPIGEIGMDYRAGIQANRYVAWTVEGLPLGLSFRSAGDSSYIAGTPLVTGTFTVAIKIEEKERSATKEFTIEIVEPKKPVIVTTSLPKGTVYEYYEEQLVSTSPSAEWSIVEGELPKGLWLGSYFYDGYYRISGEPEEAGTFNFTVQAKNNFGEDTKAFSIVIDLPPLPIITTLALPNGVVGEQYSASILSENNGTMNLKTGSSLPLGFNYICEDTWCAIGGVPTTTGDFSFTFVATNISGSVEKTYTIAITEELQAPVILTTTLPNGKVGEEYFEMLISESIAWWSLESGSLPNGLSISSNGIISGNPKEAGSYTFAIKAENDAGSNIKSFSIEIEGILYPPMIATTSLPNGKTDTDYLQVISATGSSPIAFSLELGSLPTGLTLSASGVLSGTPTTAGTYTFTVKAENSIGNVTRQFTIVIATDQQPDYTVTITQPSNGVIIVLNGSTVVTSGMQLPSGTVLTLVAAANSGYNFVKWWDDNTNLSREFTLTASTTISATFAGGSTPILSSQLQLATSHSPVYYTLKGQPLGTQKPTTPGVYIEYRSGIVKRIAVK